MAADPLLMEQHEAAVKHRVDDKIEKTQNSSWNPLASLYLDLSEVHRFADELVVLGQLLTRGKLDEHFAQLSPISMDTKKLWAQYHHVRAEFIRNSLFLMYVYNL